MTAGSMFFPKHCGANELAGFNQLFPQKLTLRRDLKEAGAEMHRGEGGVSSY